MGTRKSKLHQGKILLYKHKLVITEHQWSVYLTECRNIWLLQEAISGYYRFIWNLFYAEYLLFPFL